MSDVAIRVDRLSKQYRIGQRERYHSLRDSLTRAFSAPLRWLRSRKSANKRNEADTIWALQDVSFEVKRGEVVGIIGRNGAGKSTLLKILSRITEPTAGEVQVHGRVGSLLEVGTGFHPELTGRENIFLNGAILGMKRAEIARKFDEIVAFAETEKFLDTAVKHYSSGMYMRLAFAVAAHLEPEILLVDEVLAVGDQQFQKKCLGKMEEAALGGRTVLFVSHNLDMIEALTNRCELLDFGQLARSGPTTEVVNHYLSLRPEVHDFNEIRGRRGTGLVRIKSVTYSDAEGRIGTCFRPGEPITITFVIQSDFDGEWDLAFAVETIASTPIFASHLTDALPPQRFQGDKHFEVVLKPNLLRQGQYRLSMGVYSLSVDTIHDELLHVPQFEIAGHGQDFPSDRRWGSIYLPLKWTERT